jgi:ligand-binding sensor domain-containing protein
LLESRDGALWLGLRLQGLQRWNAGAFSPVRTSHQRINDLIEDDEGNLWVGTAGGGLNRLQRARFSLLGEEAGGVCEDRSGAIWFANRNGGVLKIREGNVVAANQKGWPKKAIPICPDLAGNIWIGTGPRLCRVTADHDEPPAWIEMEDIGTIHVIFTARDGSVWVGGETGPPLRFRGDTHESYGASRGFTNSRVLAIGEDAAGHIWIGTEGGDLCELVNNRFC